ncbi:Rho GTPase activation protein [Schizopora paradoxa]|uniref:Rho GTPase activation protein n=1 Tax=Schizopora paradoxa TaxID=27342 RepID=A0A0H2RPD0_9AGAM|nr:Rho GTPase activation protein [Schizopora paradoxa]
MAEATSIHSQTRRSGSSLGEGSQFSHSRQTSLNESRMQNYGNLLFTLRSEPQHLVALLYFARPPALDRLVLTMMNSIYGSTQSGEAQDEDGQLYGMLRMVFSRDLAVSKDNREAYWRGGVTGKILGTYARRRTCQLYVTATLGDYVSRIVEHELLNVEIEPVKVYQQIVDQTKEMGGLPSNFVDEITATEAAAIPGVQDIVKQRVTMLVEIATNILNAIIENVVTVPIETRRICALIRDVCKENQPDLTDAAIYGLLGDFLFVRLLIPALLRPHAHGLVGSAPSVNPSRTLTLVSKMLRSICVRSSEDLEPYMEKITNEFSEINTPRANDFFRRMCEVHPEDGGASNSAVCPAEGSITIRMDALNHLHAMLVDFGDKLSITGDHKRLSEIAAQCGPRPSQAQLDSKDGRVLHFRYSIPSSVGHLPR